MGRIHYNDTYDYEIFEDGYEIYYGASVISQRGIYSHPYLPEGTYEENCLAQLEDLSRPVDPSTDTEVLRSDVDYIALMEDLDLPSSQSEEGE